VFFGAVVEDGVGSYGLAVQGDLDSVADNAYLDALAGMVSADR
jgi:hypothetical protein